MNGILSFFTILVTSVFVLSIKQRKDFKIINYKYPLTSTVISNYPEYINYEEFMEIISIWAKQYHYYYKITDNHIILRKGNGWFTSFTEIIIYFSDEKNSFDEDVEYLILQFREGIRAPIKPIFIPLACDDYYIKSRRKKKIVPINELLLKLKAPILKLK